MSGLTGSSRVNVELTGDRSDLQRELRGAEGDVGRFGTSTKKILAAGALTAAAAGIAEIGAEALEQGDRLGDATARIELQVGDLSAQLVTTADDFTDLGLSAQDVLELEAAVLDTGTALGITDDELVDFADDVAATAGAVALLTDLEAPEVVGLIGKAADGSEKAMKALGVNIDEAEVVARALADTGKDTAESLTDGELAAARYKEILEELAPKLEEVDAGQQDVEQSTAELQAKWETLMGKIGEGIDGPLNDFLGWTLAGVEGWELFAASMAAPEERLRAIFGLMLSIGQLNPFGNAGTQIFEQGGGFDALNGNAGKGSSVAPKRTDVTINVQPRDAADTERAVVNALRDYDRRNGRQQL